MSFKRAIFFDRDGVLNRELGDYVCKPEDFDILPDAVECIKLANERGFLSIIITNQGGIDKGLYTHETLAAIHRKIIDACQKEGAKIDDIFYCPHHPKVSMCLCRKPDSMMLEKAVGKFGLNIDECIMIGDTERDMQAAEKLGIKGILIQPNSPKLRLLTEEIDRIDR